MATLQVDLFDRVNNRRIWVSLRDNLLVRDIIQKLINDLELPQGEYELLDQSSNRKLPIDATLKDAGVQNEQLLRIQRKKKIPAVIPVPIIPLSKVRAETGMKGPSGKLPTEKSTPGDEPGPASEKIKESDAQPTPDKSQERDFSRQVSEKVKLPPPPPRPQARPPEDAAGRGFWHRPFRQPRFFAWIPTVIWFYFRPIIILVIIMIMIICCGAGMCTCRIPGFFKKPVAAIPVILPADALPPGKNQTAYDVNSPENYIFKEAAFTYHNPSAIDAFCQGNYDPGSSERITDPSFADLADALESGKVVVLENLGWVSDCPDPIEFIYPEKYVVTSVNRIENQNGFFNVGLADPETGIEIIALMDNLGFHLNPEGGCGVAEITSWTMDIFKPMEPVCTYGTSYIVMNLDSPPYNDIEVRKSLAAITNRETYLQETQGNTEGLSYSLIPQQLLGEYSYLGDNYTTSFTQSTELDFSTLGSIELSYCGACEGSDVYANTVTNLWGKSIGSGVRAKPITHEQYQQPIRGQQIGMSFVSGATNSWFDFAYQWVKDGYIMVPEADYENYMQFVKAAALESDKEKQARMIIEINRLLVEKFVSVIPLYWQVNCE